MAMYFHCRECGGEHRSQIQMPRATFESPTTVITKSRGRCPSTLVVTTCDKGQMYWKDEPATNAA